MFGCTGIKTRRRKMEPHYFSVVIYRYLVFNWICLVAELALVLLGNCACSTRNIFWILFRAGSLIKRQFHKWLFVVLEDISLFSFHPGHAVGPFWMIQILLFSVVDKVILLSFKWVMWWKTIHQGIVSSKYEIAGLAFWWEVTIRPPCCKYGQRGLKLRRMKLMLLTPEL